MIRIVKTTGAQSTVSYGSFDDFIIIETLDLSQQLQIRPEEFDFLMKQLYKYYWEKRQVKYIQILKEWNECIGYNGLEENPSIIMDIQDTIDALNVVNNDNQSVWNILSQTDLSLIIEFMTSFEKNGVRIRKE